MPIEHIVDGLMRNLKKNVAARTPFIADAAAGTGLILVDNNFHFEDSVEVVIVDNDTAQTGYREFHTILYRPDSTNQVQLLHPLQKEFTVANGAMMAKAIGNLDFYEDRILFGDRSVIPFPQSAVICVEPVNMTNEWIYIEGGLNEEYSCYIMIYVRNDKHEDAMRLVCKYADNIYELLVGQIHLDIVSHEVPLSADVNHWAEKVYVTSVSGFQEEREAVYDIQDNNNAEIDFRVVYVSPTESYVTLNRRLQHDYRMADKAVFRRRGVYIYDSRVNSVTYGEIQKDGALYKAARLEWFGKQTQQFIFPQKQRGGQF